MWNHFHPAEDQLESEADELNDAGQIDSTDLRMQCDQRVEIEIELTSDELCALVSRSKASELAVKDVLNFLLQNNLLS